MQISYYSALANKLLFCPNKNSKITKLKKNKNKNKIKNFFSIPPGIARNWPVRPVFFPVQNRGLYVPVCLPVRYEINSLD